MYFFAKQNVKNYGVDVMLADAQPQLQAVVPLLAQVNIELKLMDPGAHQTLAEINIGHSDRRKISILAGLPYVLAPQYDNYILQWLCDTHNAVTNVKSRPSTPDVLVRGAARRLNGYNFVLGFGAVCMVQQHGAKRKAIATTDGTFVKNIPHAELGVLLGHSILFPGDYLFLLSNGEIVDREVADVVNTVPFGWPSRPVHVAQMAPPSPHPHEPLAPISTQTSVQMPGAPLSASLPADLLQALPRAPLSAPVILPAVVPSLPIVPFSVPVSHVPDSVPFLAPVLPSLLPSLNDRLPLPVPSFPVSAALPVPARSRPVRAVALPPGFWTGAIAAPLTPVVPCFACRPGLIVCPNCQSHHESALQTLHDCSEASDAIFIGMFTTTAMSATLALLTPTEARAEHDFFLAAQLRQSARHPVPSVSAPWTVVRHGARSAAQSERRALSAYTDASRSILHVSPVPVRLSSLTPAGPSRQVHRVQVRAADRIVRKAAAALLVARKEQEEYYLTAAVAINRETAEILQRNRELVSFDTMLSDEFDLDGAAAHFAAHDSSPHGSASSAFAASRTPFAALEPSPAQACKEVTLRKALQTQDLAKLSAATATELEKQQSLGCLGTIAYDYSDLPPDPCVVHAVVIYKEKDDGRYTCRIAGDGSPRANIPLMEGSDTYASVVSDSDKMATLAFMQGHCASRGEIIHMEDFDVVGGFLRIKRTSSIRLFLKIPVTLPHSLAGKYLEIFGALYGLQESNHLFMKEVTRVVLSAGFTASQVSPMTFVKHDSRDPGRKCVVNVHVDDFRTIDNAPELRQSLILALEARFGHLTTHSPCITFAGVEFKIHPSGAVSTTQDRYIARVADRVGVTHLPSTDVPIHSDFFQPSVTDSDCMPVPPLVYQALTGHLIQVLKTRDDVRHFVSHLCSCNAAPTSGDYEKALHLLRYLKSTPGMGRVFHATSTTLCAYADAAWALHSDGTSGASFFLSVGADNAPFHTEAKAQLDVATCQMTAEYYAAGAACMSLMHYRQLAEDLGWPQSGATSLFVDNKTAISLVRAPEVTRKSRHIVVKHHYIRQLHQRELIRMVHVKSTDMRANVLTKFLPRLQYHRERDLLFNRQALEVASSVSCVV